MLARKKAINMKQKRMKKEPKHKRPYARTTRWHVTAPLGGSAPHARHAPAASADTVPHRAATLGSSPSSKASFTRTLCCKAATHKKTEGQRSPSVVREIVYGMSLGLLVGYLWKLHHWSNQRRTRELYSLLDEGTISVVVDEAAGAKDYHYPYSFTYLLGELEQECG
ncbi:hypothetical protein VPH35_050103 [Triticum aestivum]|uniref:Cytochrome c oxidase subunit 5C n=2 Tax=Triticum TaxID=4564 RepID=A0A9R1RXT5_TRITD|nr:unnamed protein product [Triticum aestivum]VAH72944.1 unnamed protein product [Triticum turgidum subsp. durum]